MSSIPTIPPDPAAPPAPEREMSVAPIGLPRYQVVRELGRGTMGIVHQAHDLVADRMVALKTVPIPVIMTATERQDFVNRFLAEARIVTRLTHPNIVRVFDFGQDEPSGLLFVALEYLDGAPLSEIVSPSSPLPWPEALRIAERVADALSHA